MNFLGETLTLSAETLEGRYVEEVEYVEVEFGSALEDDETVSE